ncbi:MAG: type II toxin-antitoxin system HicB family antitoxin [Calditrichaeota bacterium]|nr:type II toxin-antitoxin system HicB family antitoxin [Calditrichota bacterium]
MRYLIVIEKADGNYCAYSPDVPGCVAAGETPDETAREMQEAIRFHQEGLLEDGLPLPEPTSWAEWVTA